MPASEPVTAIANALAELFGFARPLLDEHLAQRYRQQAQAALATWSDVAGRRRPGELAEFIDGVLVAAEHPAGLVSPDDQLAVPAGHLDELVRAAIELARLKRELASLTTAMKTQQR
jgi:hypothetical protein